MKYLNTKTGSIEEVVANMTKSIRQDGAYQDMFKKELDKAGRPIGAMTPKEKSAFFNKIDAKYKAKSEGGPPADGGPGSGSHNKDGASKSNDKTTSSSSSKSDIKKALKSVPEPGSDYDPSDYSKIKSMAKKTGDTTAVNIITKMNKAHSDIDDAGVKKHFKDLRKHLGEDDEIDYITKKKVDKEKGGKKLADTGTKATKVETEPEVDYEH